MLLLAAAPRGLSGDELAVLLYEDDVSTSTLRAELNRLRALLGDDLLASRPYRLAAEVTARLAGGRGAPRRRRRWTAPCAPTAARCCPRSTAPGVGRLRRSVEGQLRRAVLASREPDLMSTWTRSAWGADDYEMWQAQLGRLGRHLTAAAAGRPGRSPGSTASSALA